MAGLRKGGLRLAVGTPGVPVGTTPARSCAGSSLRCAHPQPRQPGDERSGVVSKVALGSADAGFAYVTDGLTARGRVKAIALPRWAQPPVRYQACVVRRRGGDGAGGNAFLRRLRAHGGPPRPEGRRVRAARRGADARGGDRPGAGFTALLALRRRSR